MLTKQKIKKIIIILVCMSILGLTCLFYSLLNPLIIKTFKTKFSLVTNQNNMLVHFIDVNQGDAVAINLPDGKIMLIDDGKKEYNVDYTNYLKENVLSTKHDNKIDYLVLSHADADHVGGTMKLLKNFDVDMVFIPKVISNSATFKEIYDYVTTNCDYQVLGDGFVVSNNSYEINFFESLNSSNLNDSSQVVKLEYLNKSFLFSGDISSSIEDDYVNVYAQQLDCDVLKVSHHGASSSTSDLFLQCTTPQFAVISVGEDNDYKHPTEEVLDRLQNSGAEILRTDKDGDILFVVGDNYNLNVLNGKYYITSLSLDYRNLVLVVDAVLLVVLVIMFVKKEKKKNKHKSNKV